MLVKIIWIVAGALIAVGAMIWLGKAAEAKEESSKEEPSDEKSSDEKSPDEKSPQA